MNRDMRGKEIKVNDRVVYGKSCRHTPIKIGTVKRLDHNSVYILGDGSSKQGCIRESRVLVLPEDYKEGNNE